MSTNFFLSLFLTRKTEVISKVHSLKKERTKCFSFEYYPLLAQFLALLHCAAFAFNVIFLR